MLPILDIQKSGAYPLPGIFYIPFLLLRLYSDVCCCSTAYFFQIPLEIVKKA